MAKLATVEFVEDRQFLLEFSVHDDSSRRGAGQTSHEKNDYGDEKSLVHTEIVVLFGGCKQKPVDIKALVLVTVWQNKARLLGVTSVFIFYTESNGSHVSFNLSTIKIFERSPKCAGTCIYLQ